jgi:hypothetical protein
MSDNTNDEKDAGKLLAALKAERAAHKETTDKLKESDAALSAANVKIAEAATLASPTGEGIQRLVQDSAKALSAKATAELQQRVTTLEAELDSATKSNAALTAKFQRTTIEGVVRQAAAEDHVRQDAVADLLVFAAADLKLNDAGEVVTEDGASIKEWLDVRKSTSPYFWPVSRGAGGRGSIHDTMPAYDGDSNPFRPGPGWSLTRQSQLTRENPELAKRLQGQVPL